MILALLPALAYAAFRALLLLLHALYLALLMILRTVLRFAQGG